MRAFNFGNRACLVLLWAVFTAAPALAQEGQSDSDLVSTLEDMVEDMGLDSIASQTYGTRRVVAPKLSSYDVAEKLGVTGCDSVIARAEDGGMRVEFVIGEADAALDTCRMSESGNMVAYMLLRP